MFYCERCSTRFNAGAASSVDFCPRCKSKDGVAVPLRFRLFERSPVIEFEKGKAEGQEARPRATAS